MLSMYCICAYAEATQCASVHRNADRADAGINYERCDNIIITINTTEINVFTNTTHLFTAFKYLPNVFLSSANRFILIHTFLDCWCFLFCWFHRGRRWYTWQGKDVNKRIERDDAHRPCLNKNYQVNREESNIVSFLLPFLVERKKGHWKELVM